MSKDSKTPGDRREKIRQKELNHPASGIQGTVLSDLVGSFSWKGTGLMILLLLIGFIIYASLFQ
jgi:hypothetical protein